MTQEDKELLIKDLCARLPYGVKCHFKYGSAEGDVTLGCIDNGVARFEYGWYGRVHVSIDADYIKPYLRPMSSMTEEEMQDAMEKFFDGSDHYGIDDIGEIYADTDQPYTSIYTLSFVRLFGYVNWLNEHHFDYRGLIPMGLALEAPEGMYKI